MKQTLQNRFPRRWLLLAFVLNFAIAAAALLPYMIRDGGLLLVAADFDAEQLSYNMLCNNAIKSGEVCGTGALILVRTLYPRSVFTPLAARFSG